MSGRLLYLIFGRGFKYWRLAAINFVLNNLRDTPSKIRIMGPSLRLGAISIWILNSLIFRPGEQRWDKDIVDISAAYEVAEEEDPADQQEMMELAEAGLSAPMLHVRGCYFIAGILSSRGYLRCPVVRELDVATLARVYNCNSFAELQQEFMASDLKRLRKVNYQPRRNRARPLPAIVDHDPAQDVAFNLQEAGVRAGPSTMLTGRDITRERGPDAEGDVLDIDREVNTIWRQFLLDIIHVAPRSNDGPYCTLSDQEKQSVTRELYLSHDIPFRKAIVKAAPRTTWDLFFDRFFPTIRMWRERQERRAQNYGACRWWILWGLLIQKLQGESTTIVRNMLKQQFDTLRWLPWSGSDRIWVTGSKQTGHCRRVPEGSTGTAVSIAVNTQSGCSITDIQIR